MGYVLIAVALAALVISLGFVIEPQATWWMVVSWFFKQPEMLEPSSIGYLALRIIGVLSLLSNGRLLFGAFALL